MAACIAIHADGAFAADGLSGKVVETMNSGGYTYALIEKDGNSLWVAVPQTKITAGETVTFLPGAEMKNFQSKTLNRTFDSIIFSNGVAGSGPVTGDAGGPVSKGALTVPPAKINVKKASGPNAYRVEEIYRNIESLDKKKVSVRGKVGKVSTGIMDMTWIHLQDGSGDPKKGSHDLVITTEETPEVGSIITATGVIAKDRDFGSNYKYRAIMEKAILKK